ncbi:putative ATP-grasp-modified RiPP [Streptomyces sp. NPDC000927]|uniref:putative ATP-grasp-modified RiPP n=1 Tax=Streptomyces sp. NPDC000927 TaxID=3154371 RepID=UPI003322DAC9
MTTMTPTKPEALRPFGLTRTVPLDTSPAANPLDGLRYDPALQLNVTTDGTPVINSPQMPSMSTSQNTQADHQWWTDKD